MRLELKGRFLPLGSMLQLKETEDDSLLYFIVARAIAKNNTGEIVPRYKVAPHPYGDTPNQEVFSIDATQIVKVLFEGYENNKDVEFVENMFERMTNTLEQSNSKTNSSPINVNKSQEEEIENLRKDPFYKFRK